MDKSIKEIDCTRLTPPSKKYTVAIVGCGSIGALKKDRYDNPTTGHSYEDYINHVTLTHAHAFYDNPNTKIVEFVDADLDRAFTAGQKWRTKEGVCASTSIKTNPDIVVIATPTETHHDMLMQVLELRPRLVVAEKPFCSTLKEAQEVHDAYKKAGIPIVVNYTRRFDPVAADIFIGLRNGDYGEIYHARCLYGRGLRRDGCHGLDLFSHVLGQLRGLSYSHCWVVDYLPSDPSYTLKLEYERCSAVYMVATDSRKWGGFEIDFVTAAGIVRFTDWGKTVQHFRVAPETTYGQYNALQASAEKIETGLTKALLYLADNAVRHLRNGTPLLCTSEDALRVHEVMEQVKI